MAHVAFDLEIANELPEGETDWKRHAPLGISIAAVRKNDRTAFVWNPDRLDRNQAEALVAGLEAIVHEGHKIVTWNGCGFDFHILAIESGEYERCAHLALNHVDLMLHVVTLRGHYLGLDRALDGAGLPRKTHTVMLRDGTEIHDMGGALAPKYWAAGEYDAVHTYLEGDVTQTQALADATLATGKISWISAKGKPNTVHVHKTNGRLATVHELFALEEPDTSWMGNPPTRRQFIDWMPAAVLAKYPNLSEYVGDAA